MERDRAGGEVGLCRGQRRGSLRRLPFSCFLRVPGSLEGWESGSVAKAEDVEVLEAAFQNVDEFVIAIGVGGGHEEAEPEDVVVGVRDDAFDGFSIVEANPDPQTLHDGCMLMKVKGAMAQIAVKGHDKEDCLGVGGSDGLSLAGIGQSETDGVEGMLRVVAQKLVDGAYLASQGEASNGVVFEADYNLVGARGGDLRGPRGYIRRRVYA